jgi:hypothetical protein
MNEALTPYRAPDRLTSRNVVAVSAFQGNAGVKKAADVKILSSGRTSKEIIFFRDLDRAASPKARNAINIRNMLFAVVAK